MARRGLVWFLTFLAVQGLSTRPAAAQSLTVRTDLDPRRADWLFGESPVPIPTILENALRIQTETRRPLSLVLHVFRIRDGRVVAKHRSDAFTYQPGQPVYGNLTFLPAEKFYGGEAYAGPEDVIEASRSVPASDGVTQPARFVVDGIFPNKPDDWGEREAVYVIAVPASSRTLTGASAYPIVLFDKSTPLGDPLASRSGHSRTAAPIPPFLTRPSAATVRARSPARAGDEIRD